MQNKNYSEEQINEIRERVNKANKLLKELDLSCVANIEPVILPSSVGENIFAFRVMPMFSDLKYAEKVKEEKVKEVVEAEVVEK